MTTFSIDEHNEDCNFVNPNYFLFQYNYDFYCIIYCSCHQGWQHHLDFKLQLIKSVAKNIGKPEKFDKYQRSNIDKSNLLSSIKNQNDISYVLSTKITEVSYIYDDRTGKEYCFGVHHCFSHFLKYNIQYSDNIRKSYNIIEEKDIFSDDVKKYLKSSLNNLIRHNRTDYEDLSDIQKVKLTTLLSKNFIKNYKHDHKSY
jgi:hypothetical protein